jgi:hypothetical protein
MSKDRRPQAPGGAIDRRGFIRWGGVAVAGGVVASRAGAGDEENATKDPSGGTTGDPRVKRYRTLGRTGFEVSDLGMGCGRINEPNVVRFAFDHGINYFDTAEGYGNGDSESKIGKALEHIDREKVFITSKLPLEAAHTEQELVDRFHRCLERLQTSYIDCMMQHGIADASLVSHEGFHKAMQRMKSEGKLKHVGISSHGPRGDEPDSMEAVLGRAAEDGRFDVFLLVYNFMNTEEGGRVLDLCAKKAIGTTLMKMTPGTIEVEPFDPEHPQGAYVGYLERMTERGMSREDAVERIQRWVNERQAAIAPTKEFMSEHGVSTESELRLTSLQWALENPKVDTICPSMPDFDMIEKTLTVSGERLSARQAAFLERCHGALERQYCRHGCRACVNACPESLSVSTIMRYSYYYALQRREKYAMQRYAALGPRNAELCLACDAPCADACPYGIDVQANLVGAHTLLTMA